MKNPDRPPAKSSDWKTVALPKEKVTIEVSRDFSPEELRQIQRGVIPEEMEDKWFVFWEDGSLYFHRSWTGYCVYVVPFSCDENGAKMTKAEVNRDPSQYTNTDDSHDVRLISYLIDVLLLRRPAQFPSKSKSRKIAGLEKWSEVGRAAYGMHPGDGTLIRRVGARVTPAVQAPFLGALLGLACGDALGAPVEFRTWEAIDEQYGRLTEMVGGGNFGWAPGEWTDDTGMALCVAEGILARPGDPVQEVGTRFLDWAATARDVGGTIAAALANARLQVHGQRPETDTPPGVGKPAPIDWPEASRTTPQAQSGKAAGNGSLMRTLPIALAYPDARQMLDVSARISAMTHWDPQAEVCCALYCFWVKEILSGSPPRAAWESALELARDAVDEDKRSDDTPGPVPLPDHFWDRLERAPDLARKEIQPTGYAGYVVHCLEAAVWAAVNLDRLEEALVELVNLGGETDTMAAVAGGAVGAHFGLQAIPTRWLQVLLQRSRLEHVARDLHELRHRLVYETPDLPDFWFLELERGLLYGRNPLTAIDVKRLIAAGVTRVLDLREDHEWNRPDRYGREAVAALERCGDVRESVPIKDTTAPSPEQLDRTWEILSNALAQEETVFVHCRGGIERTGTVIAAYLARRDGLSVDETLQRFAQGNTRLNPLPHQIEAARRWLASHE